VTVQQKYSRSNEPGILAGFAYPLQALGLLRQNPRLWGYVAVPIAINLILGGLIYLGVLLPGFQGIDRLIDRLPDWAEFLDWLLRGVLALLLFVATGFLLTQVGVVLGAPWYGALAEKIELAQWGALPPAEPFHPAYLLRDLWRAVLFEVKKLVLLATVSLLLFGLGFVFPGVGAVVATIVTLASAALIACLDFFDPVLERRRLRFRRKLAIVLGQMPGSASFGLACVGLVSVPLLNLLTVPICVMSGTLFCCDRVLPKLDSTTSSPNSEEHS